MALHLHARGGNPGDDSAATATVPTSPPSSTYYRTHPVPPMPQVSGSTGGFWGLLFGLVILVAAVAAGVFFLMKRRRIMRQRRRGRRAQNQFPMRTAGDSDMNDGGGGDSAKGWSKLHDDHDDEHNQGYDDDYEGAFDLPTSQNQSTFDLSIQRVPPLNPSELSLDLKELRKTELYGEGGGDEVEATEHREERGNFVGDGK